MSAPAMTSMRLLRAVTAGVMIALASPAAGQDKKIDDYYVDFAVPDVPALGLFDLNPNKVSRPGGLKELSLSLLPLATRDAKIGSGLALSWAPVYTFTKSVAGYRSGFQRRLAFSAATVKNGKTDAITLGVGARVVVIDESDPLLDDKFNAEVLAILEKSLNGQQRANDFTNQQATPVVRDVTALMTSDVVKQAELMQQLNELWNIMAIPPGGNAELQFLRFQRAINRAANPAENVRAVDLSSHPDLRGRVEQLARAYVLAEIPPPATSKAALAKVRDTFAEAHWNAPVVTVDVGELSVSSTGTWGDLRAEQFGISLLAALPAGRSGQLLLQGQSRQGLGDDAEEEWYYAGGARVLLGSATKRVSIEGLIAKARTDDRETDGVSKRVTVGTEVRVIKGFWLELALGSEWTPATRGRGTNLLSLAALKYAFKTKPRFTEVPGVTDEN
jgi:hypothetical protein